MTEHFITLSTTEPNNYVGLIKMRQGDINTQTIQATITANGQLFKFDRLSVFFNAVLPNGNVIRDKVTEVDYVNSKLNYVVADSFLQEVAQVTAWFSFENGDKIIDSTKNFQYSVIGGWKECIPQGNYIYELSEIQREIEEIIGNKDFTSLISKISSLETDVKYTGSRIDNLIANAGNGTIPSELVDMRVGADGKVRGTAGNAMREQFQAVNMAATSSNDVFFTNGIMPSISILQDYSIKVSFPKGPNAYTRLNAFGRDGKKVAELWTYGFTENSGKSTFAESYTIPSGSSLLWNLSSNALLVDSVDKTKAYLNINLLTNYSGVPSSGKFMEYITNAVSEKIGSSFYISKGLFPTFATSGTDDLVITMPTSGGIYSRLFLNVKNTEHILWPEGYTENAGKKLYQTTYTVPNANGLYWDTSTDTLQIARLTSAIPSSYVLMAANINGYIAAGEFYKYKVNNVEKAIFSIEGVKNSPYTFICRQGQLGGRPENSLEGVMYAKENGYDDIRVSVKFTTDGIPVLFHDTELGYNVKNSDGTAVASGISFSSLTYAQLSNYDFGIYYGSQYKGLVCPKLEDFLELCAFKGINPTLEIKEEAITEEQVMAILAPVLQYGLTDRTFISSHQTNVLDAFFTKCKSLNYALISYPEVVNANKVLNYRHLSNTIRMDIFDINNPTLDFLLYARDNDIKLKVGSCYNVEQIKTWMGKGVDCIEVADVANPKTVIFNAI
ncbi:BppU family phage baseplate upper protein [Lactococcus lactis]|uniref:BppU family phage baseplate upper protein n=1 Tax=Lactococcus lactis TaxID=1358 RepID=UPI00288E9660|nr:BppU family phage baseplate upper protein [Lactococcus lactis]MDT2905892.1 BppU family phage baseplate upper protein [Lactococcus lactis]